MNAAKYFVLLETLVTFYFANKMMRLIIFLAPVASVLGGVALEAAMTWALTQATLFIPYLHDHVLAATPAVVDAIPAAPAADVLPVPPKPSGKESRETPKKNRAAPSAAAPAAAEYTDVLGVSLPTSVTSQFSFMYTSTVGKAGRVAVAAGIAFVLVTRSPSFYEFADVYARQISNPSIMFKARLNDGREVMIDDYRQAYWWLSKNTPADSRVLAWWDYGYQINGIGNRTSLADGNTWNLEHIALVGRCLAFPERKAHKLIRHLADYVLGECSARCVVRCT